MGMRPALGDFNNRVDIHQLFIEPALAQGIVRMVGSDVHFAAQEGDVEFGPAVADDGPGLFQAD
jgi:hypothetical protein